MLGISRRWAGWRFAKNTLAAVFTAALFLYLYAWRLGTLTPGFSPREALAIKGSASFSAIRSNPINAPHKLLQFLFQSLGHHGAFWMRSVSVFFAFIFLVALFMLLKKWFGAFIGFVGVILAATLPWMVLVARSASSDVMLLSSIFVIFAYVLLTSAKKYIALKWCLLMLCMAIAIYTPGLIWFIAFAILASYKQISKKLAEVNFASAVLGLVALMLLATPLVVAIYQHPTLAKDWLLIPHSFTTSMALIKQTGWSLATLMYKSKQHIDYTIGHLPILSITQSILALIGIYVMGKSAKRQLFALLGLQVLAIVAASLNNNPHLLTICLPAIIIIDAAALRFLYIKWLKVFPLNPIPRAFAASLIGLLLLAQVAYGARYIMAAWPHSVETRNTYVLK